MKGIQYHETDITLPQNESIFGQYRYEIPVIRIGENFVLRNKQITSDAIKKGLVACAEDC